MWRPCTYIFAAICLPPLALAAEPPIIVHTFNSQIAVSADGSYAQTTHTEGSATNKGAIERLARAAISFNPTLETLDIVEAYTLKPDGTRKEVDAAAIRAQLAPGVPNVAMFADIQQKVIVYPDVAPGDRVVATWHRTAKPLFPGQFIWNTEFAQDIAWNDVSNVITAPPGFALHVQGIGVQTEQTNDADGTKVSIRYSQPEAVAFEQYGVSASDRRPRAFVSSFPDYAAMAAAYDALSRDKARVTPRVQAEADRITAGITDRRGQASALHAFAAGQIRYVALYLGRGGVEPHAADDVLVNGYGDCKDHTVLFTALLAAKGIDSRYALINLGNAYQLAGPPTLAVLNHVITYIPEFDLYVDPTSATTGLSQLMLEHFGKTVVLTGAGPALRQVPQAVLADNTGTTRTSARLEADGRITGNTVTSGTGTFAVALRAIGQIVEGQGNAAVTQKVLSNQRQTGTGEMSVPKINLAAPDYSLGARFTLEPQPGILEGDAFAPPLGPLLLPRPGDVLIGPLARAFLPDSEPTPCMAGRQVEELALALPEGRRPARLPPDRRIAADAFTYTSGWKFAEGTLTVRRELESRVADAQCTDGLRRAAAAALRDIRRDQQVTLTLEEP